MRLSKLYLLKEYRGRGIGSYLLEYVEDRAREEGLRRVHLEVNIYRTASRHFYESHGYAEVDILDGYRIIMAKVL
jgi:GNAT superfamily N-acetyltransferase